MSSSRNLRFLRSWEGLLSLILIVAILINIQLSPYFLHGDNLINLFGVSIEKIIVALPMAFIIINGEIDLSVASVTVQLAVNLWLLHREFASKLSAATAPIPQPVAAEM